MFNIISKISTKGIGDTNEFITHEKYKTAQCCYHDNTNIMPCGVQSTVKDHFVCNLRFFRVFDFQQNRILH